MSVRVGTCTHCLLDIFAPMDGVVWTESGAYHVACREALLLVGARERASSVSRTPTRAA